MEMLLACEVEEWEQLFWNKFKALLYQIGNNRVEEKERLTREWKANCWKRLNTQMHAAQKRSDKLEGHSGFKLQRLGKRWASVSQISDSEAVGRLSITLSNFRKQIKDVDDEIHLRMEKEIEDTEFR